MTAFVRTWIGLLALVLLTGCASTDDEKFGQEVQKWVPLGTSAKEAQRIMESHGFDCSVLKKDSPFNHHGTDAIECERGEAWLHTWSTVIYLADDKVSGYGDSTVENNYHQK